MLDESWSDQVHEDFDPKVAPTFSNVALIEGAAEQAVSEVVKRKPGRPKKVEP